MQIFYTNLWKKTDARGAGGFGRFRCAHAMRVLWGRGYPVFFLAGRVSESFD
jgi:hypothetical protein